MILPLIGRVRGKSFGVGMVAAGLASVFARPLLVGIVRAGYEVKDAADSLWHQAKEEAASVRAEARTGRDAGTEAEIVRLREEIAALRASKRAS